MHECCICYQDTTIKTNESIMTGEDVMDISSNELIDIITEILNND